MYTYILYRVRVIILFKVNRENKLSILLVTCLIAVVKHLMRNNVTGERYTCSRSGQTSIKMSWAQAALSDLPLPHQHNHTNSLTYPSLRNKERKSGNGEKRQKEDPGQNQTQWGQQEEDDDPK